MILFCEAFREGLNKTGWYVYCYKRLQLLVNIGNCRPQQSQKRMLSQSILLFWIQNEGFLCSWAGHTATTATVALLLALSGSSRWRWPLLGGVSRSWSFHSVPKKNKTTATAPAFWDQPNIKKGLLSMISKLELQFFLGACSFHVFSLRWAAVICVI